MEAKLHETPEKREAVMLAEAHEDALDRTTTQMTTEDLSTAFQACMSATSPDRQRDVPRVIQAFTKTVAAAHPSLAPGPDPPALGAIAARFLPPSRCSSQRPSSSAPTLLNPTLGLIPLPPAPHPVHQSRRPPSNWTAP